MMTKKIFFTLFISFFIALGLKAQSYDKITLKAGAIKEGTLSPQNQDFTKVERVSFLDQTGAKKSIPLKAIKRIVLKNSKEVFPIPKKVEITQVPTKTNSEVAQNNSNSTATEYTNSIIYDTIFLKTGKAMPCVLNLNGLNINTLERIPFVNLKGVEKSIPKMAVAKMKNKEGKILFPETVIQKIEVPKYDCKKESEALKLEIENVALNRYNAIQEEINEKTSAFKNANSAMEEKVRNQVYAGIKYDVEKLKEFTTSVDAVITIEVDRKGKLKDHTDKVEAYQELRNYTKLRDTKIYPFLEKKTYPTSEVAVDYSGEYEKIYQQFESRINSSKCPDEFDEVLSLAKSRFNSIESKFMSTNTVYTIAIQYNFSRVIQKWTYFNEQLKIKNKSDFIDVTNRDTKNQFLSKLKYKQLNGKYQVNASYYSLLNDSSKISVNHVKRKYKYLTHFGVSTFAHIPLHRLLQSPQTFSNSVGDIYTFNINVIFHRIGFFGGTMYNFNKLTNYETGTYINQKFPTYGEGGIYVGLAQYFYLKAGYSYLKTDIVEYDNRLLMYKEKGRVSHGFIAGMALIFPYVNVEWGYNSNLGSFYAGMGLHVTLNK